MTASSGTQGSLPSREPMLAWSLMSPSSCYHGNKGITGTDDTSIIATVIIITWNNQGCTCPMSLASP